MDGDTARGVIRAENDAARKLLQAGLIERGRQAEALAKALRPWTKGKAEPDWRMWGPPDRRMEPELVRTLSAAFKWSNIQPLAGADWKADPATGKTPIYREPDWDGIPGGIWAALVYSDGPSPETGLHSKGAIAYAVRFAHDSLEDCAKLCLEARPPELVLGVPDEVHPPRHGKLEDGVLARLLTEDLTDQIKGGQAMEAALAAGESIPLTVQGWCANVVEVLAGLTPGVGRDFEYLTKESAACDSPYVADANALRRAYLTLGLAYLEEVRERMSDYAEASRQSAPETTVSMTFSGGTFYGGQFAAQIANIDSTIAGVLRRGDTAVADALKALEQAVLSKDDTDGEQRGDLLDNVAYLAEAAQTPPEKRNRGIIKSVLAALRTAATGSADLAKVMNAWGEVLQGLLP